MSDSLEQIARALTGRYRIDREVGAGGMATVYLAEDTKHRRQVAVKVLRPELAASMGSERFLREIEIAAGLQHPHILPLYDSGSSDGVLYYVMPFVDGPSLRDRMDRDGSLAIADTVRFVREILDALAYAHARGLMHRDIKPENVLLSGGHALVADFGVAKAVSDAAGEARITSTGIALGTPAYMAPEQATADPGLDHRVDLYAVGVIAYEMLAGRGPFIATTAQRMIAAHLTMTPDALLPLRPDAPPALVNVVMRALEKDPLARWASAHAMLDALDATFTPIGTPGVSAIQEAAHAARPATTKAPRRRGKIFAVAAALLLAIGALGAVRYTQTGRSGTLIGNAVLDANDIVLVGEFENRTGDTTLAATVTDAVRAEMQQSRAVQVMSQATMWAGLKRMGLERGVALPRTKLQELAEREGAKAFIVGDIARVGGGYQIVARVVATKDGSEQLTARATARNDDELIHAVEDVGRTLRRGVGESLRAVASTAPLAQVMTASLPALRTYPAAARAETEGDRPKAITLAKDAIALDSAFASAWTLLATTYVNMDSIAASAAATEHASRYADRLSDKQRLRLKARLERQRGNYVAEEAAWQELAEQWHDEVNYANMLLQSDRVVEAEVMARRAVAAERPSSIAYWNLAEAQVAQHKWAAADSTLRLTAQRLPNHPYVRYIEWSLLFARRDYDRAEQDFAAAVKSGFKEAASPRCILRLFRGRVLDFRACADGEQDKFLGDPQLALTEFRLTGDTARAALVYSPFVRGTAADRSMDAYPVMIALLADAGRIADAERLLDEWRARSVTNGIGFRSDSARAVGAIAVAKGQWDRAVRAFVAWHGSVASGSYIQHNRGLPEAAAVYRRLGQPDSAIAFYERALGTSSLAFGELYEGTWYAEALVALGELYEQKGNASKAAEYYRTYVALMKDADAPIAKRVANVRERLVRLTGDAPVAPSRGGT
jgi:serine/threonine-protein kinase